MRIYVILIFLSHVVAGVCAQSSSLMLSETYKNKDELYSRNLSILKNEYMSFKEGTLNIEDFSGRISEVNVKNIADGLNSFFLSPTGNYFVAFEEREGPSDYLYFYTREGLVIERCRLNIYPSIRFTLDGKYVAAFDSFGKEIFILDSAGSLLRVLNYQEVIGDKTSPLTNIVLSDDGERMLINADSFSYVFDIGTNKISARLKTNLIVEGAFIPKQDKVVLISSTHGSGKTLSVVTLEGEVVDTLNGIEDVYSLGTRILVKRNSQYECYVVR